MNVISIDRAPVLTLNAAVVAQRLGFNEDEALSLGKAVAGLNAHRSHVRPQASVQPLPRQGGRGQR
jgi:hypothetical protein